MERKISQSIYEFIGNLHNFIYIPKNIKNKVFSTAQCYGAALTSWRSTAVLFYECWNDEGRNKY